MSSAAPAETAVAARRAASVPSAPGCRPPWLARPAGAFPASPCSLPGCFFADDRYWLPLFTRYMALALFALSVDLIWGYTGLLSLGQGLYFGMGVYAVGYSLMFQKACLGRRPAPGPAGRTCAPAAAVRPARLDGYLVHIWFALALPSLMPGRWSATVFGYFTFRRRIKGVYFSLITQALLLAVFTLVVNQHAYTGGVVGMTYLAKLKLFGHQFTMVQPCTT